MINLNNIVGIGLFHMLIKIYIKRVL